MFERVDPALHRAMGLPQRDKLLGPFGGCLQRIFLTPFGPDDHRDIQLQEFPVARASEPRIKAHARGAFLNQ